MLSATCRFLALCLLQTSCAFRPSSQLGFSANTPRRTNGRAGRSTQSLFNYYDDWATDSNSRSVYDELTLPLDEESIAQCLDELVMSEYGKQMFGVHDMCASVGITGSIEFVELDGPEVLLSLAGQFWHRRGEIVEVFGDRNFRASRLLSSPEPQDGAQLRSRFVGPQDDAHYSATLL